MVGLDTWQLEERVVRVGASPVVQLTLEVPVGAAPKVPRVGRERHPQQRVAPDPIQIGVADVAKAVQEGGGVLVDEADDAVRRIDHGLPIAQPDVRADLVDVAGEVVPLGEVLRDQSFAAAGFTLRDDGRGVSLTDDLHEDES